MMLLRALATIACLVVAGPRLSSSGLSNHRYAASPETAGAAKLVPWSSCMSKTFSPTASTSELWSENVDGLSCSGPTRWVSTVPSGGAVALPTTITLSATASGPASCASVISCTKVEYAVGLAASDVKPSAAKPAVGSHSLPSTAQLINGSGTFAISIYEPNRASPIPG